jgi:hypothetical protein
MLRIFQNMPLNRFDNCTLKPETQHVFFAYNKLNKPGGKQMAQTDTISWLMEAQTPSIRYLTMTRLMDIPADDERAAAARRLIGEEGPAPAILRLQTARGDWQSEQSYYTPKYTSTHWALLLLTELAFDGADERMRRGVDYMLGAPVPWQKRATLPTKPGLTCLFGNILRYTAHCGMLDDPRAQAMVAFLAGCALDSGWTCDDNSGAPCAWGAARTLWGLAAVPQARRTVEMQDTIESGLRLLLEDYALHEANYPVGVGKQHPLWHQVSFPLFYQADILFVLRVLAELGVSRRADAAPAQQWLRQRQAANGRFKGASPYRLRTHPGMGRGEETDRWVTLHALIALKDAAPL